GTLTWPEADLAAGYDVWVQPMSGDRREVVLQRVIGTQIQLPESMRGQALRIWVSSINLLGERSVWGQPQDFAFGSSPVIIPVGILSEDDVPQIRWAAPADAVSHEVWVSNQSTKTRILHTTNISGTTFNFTEALAPAVYLIWVRSRLPDGTLTKWSSVERFHVFARPIVLTSSTSPTADATPTLTWDPVPSAQSYELFISRAGSSQPIYRRTLLQATSHRVDTPLPAANVRIWVRAFLTTGVRSFWGSGQTLQIGPASSLSYDNRTLNWTPVADVTHYELWVEFRADASGPWTRIIHESVLTTTSFQLNANSPSGMYRSWVRAIRAESGDVYNGLWSRETRFQLT
ncbi:MAG: hypothetical protein KDA85_04530, partial [Planctomycetaceae bacterium]|nr:hypothetical protein [Planctomycetaceae bacterium]